MREWLSGRASPCQGERREFESRLPLHLKSSDSIGAFFSLLINCPERAKYYFYILIYINLSNILFSNSISSSSAPA